MAGNVHPVFPLTPNFQSTTISSAITTRTVSGVTGLSLALTAGANGTRVDSIRMMATGTTTAGVIRLWKYNGSGNALMIQETLVTPSTMAISVHQSNWVGRTINVSSLAVTFSTNPTAGRAVIVGVWNHNGNPANTITSVTDNQGNTYTRAETANFQVSNINQTEIYHCLNIAASGTFTVTVNIAGGSTSNPNIAIMEVSGLLTSGALDRTGTASSTSTTTDATVSTSAATTQADELVVAVMRSNPSVDAGYSLPGYTSFGVENGAAWYCGSTDYKTVAATGTQTASWSHANTGQSGWAAVIATYKMAQASELWSEEQLPANWVLEAGETLYASTHKAESFNIDVCAQDY